MQFEFFVPSRIMFGSGALDELKDRALPGKKALLVTSCGSSAKRSGALDKVLAALEKQGCTYVLFNKIGANPDLPTVNEGARLAEKEECDYVIPVSSDRVSKPS